MGRVPSSRVLVSAACAIPTTGLACAMVSGSEARRRTAEMTSNTGSASAFCCTPISLGVRDTSMPARAHSVLLEEKALDVAVSPEEVREHFDATREHSTNPRR